MSINLNFKPSIIKVSSITSLVVPGISETIAFSSFNKALIREDLPEFGLPAMVTGIPSLITLPYLKESIKDFNLFFISLISLFKSFLFANLTSSSLKSSSSSISDVNSINFCLSNSIAVEKSPLI